ncbi:NADPH:quinone reductase [Actinokineospora iranica]|uniref:NADPH:quinone reductase n=1 Tax=Actinokineospora iranica TaxID=1271860 RepID=A0A1G6LU05_9PSEU|nr:NADPH:quinone reductase [Actinokineospora iranica]
MTAMAIIEHGSAGVLRPMTLPRPNPGHGEVRVRIRAAGVQPFDVAVRTGWSPPGASVVFPQILGNEFAGVVDAVGAGVDHLAAGDEVLGFAVLGSYAEYRVAPADQVVRKPEGMPWEVAGGFTAGAQTASIALDFLRVGAGETLLVHGGAGAVGTMAVQLARLRGVTVVATARAENHDYLRSLGAIPVAYGDGLLERVRAAAPQGVDASLDAAGGDAPRVSAELGVSGERNGTIVAFESAEKLGARRITGVRSAARLAALVDLHDRGLLRAHVRATYPLTAAADAHREVETGHGRGKVVLIIG